VDSLYNNKFFYEVVKYDDYIKLIGPFDNIRYAVDADTGEETYYKFVQIIDGMPVQVFTEEQILVTERKL
jgi:hypothetical protein